MFSFKLIILLSACLALCYSRKFQYPEGENPCVLLDIDFNAELSAYKNGKQVARKSLTPDEVGIEVTGACDSTGMQSEITLRFQDKSQWAISFQPSESYPVGMESVLSFIPKEAFGDTVAISEQQTFVSPNPMYLNDATHSYLCNNEQTSDYVTFTEPDDYNFTVSVTFFSIQAQGIDVTDRKFGPTEPCATPVQPSTVKPVPIGSSTSLKPVPFASSTSVKPVPIGPTHLPFVAPVNSYVVTKDGKTCIAMKTALTLSIKYPVNAPALTLREAVVNIPKDAVATGNCSAAPSTEALSIAFLGDWTLNITFRRYEKIRQIGRPAVGGLASPVSSYDVSNIKLTFTLDEVNFPNCALPDGTTYTIETTSADPNFPSTRDNADFYSCDSASIIDITDNVKLTTEHLQFKAFNTDSSADFTGKASVCSADKGGSSGGLGGGAIVGILLLVIFVVALSALIVLYIQRRRKLSYDAIQ